MERLPSFLGAAPQRISLQARQKLWRQIFAKYPRVIDRRSHGPSVARRTMRGAPQLLGKNSASRTQKNTWVPCVCRRDKFHKLKCITNCFYNI
jgi:hypothetical protein